MRTESTERNTVSSFGALPKERAELMLSKLNSEYLIRGGCPWYCNGHSKKPHTTK